MRASGHGAPDSRRTRRPPRAPGGPGSASSPESTGRQQDLQLRHRSGQPRPVNALGEKSPRSSQPREKLRDFQVLPESGFPATRSPLRGRQQSSPGRRSARSPRGRHSHRSPAGALGVKACPAAIRQPLTSWPCGESRIVLSSRPGGLGVLGLWKGACLTGRDGPGKPATQRGEPPP